MNKQEAIVRNKKLIMCATRDSNKRPENLNLTGRFTTIYVWFRSQWESTPMQWKSLSNFSRKKSGNFLKLGLTVEVYVPHSFHTSFRSKSMVIHSRSLSNPIWVDTIDIEHIQSTRINNQEIWSLVLIAPMKYIADIELEAQKTMGTLEYR